MPLRRAVPQRRAMMTLKEPERKKEVVSPSALRCRRIALGLTVSDLSDMAGIGEGEVLLLEMGRLPSVRPDTWAAVVAALRLQESRPSLILLPPLARAVGKGLAPARQRSASERLQPLPVSGQAPMPAGAAWWQRLRIQRARLGLSLADVRAHSGVLPYTVLLLEAGHYPTTPSALDSWRALVACLNLDAPLPPLPTLDLPQWSGWSVAGRGTSATQAQVIRRAQMMPPASPGGQLLMARLRNGWSVSRTGRALWPDASGREGRRRVEMGEALWCWPAQPSASLSALCRLWRVAPPVTWARLSRSQLAGARATVARRLEAAATSGGWGREDLCDCIGVGPLALDDLLLGRADRGRPYWALVQRATAAGFGVVDGLTLPARLARSVQLGEEGEG